MYNGLGKQLEAVKSLKQKYKDSLIWYTGGNFDKFNIALRRGEVLTEEMKKHKIRMDRAFRATLPLEFPIVVYKGKGSQNVYDDKAYVSTSLLYKKALDFAGRECCILQISVSAGSRVIPMKTVSREAHEDEVLLDRNGKLAVTGSGTVGNMKIIYATYVPYGTKIVKNDQEIKEAERSIATLGSISNLGGASTLRNPTLGSARDREVMLVVENLKDEDQEFLDDDLIRITFRQINRREISPEELIRIKRKLGI